TTAEPAAAFAASGAACLHPPWCRSGGYGFAAAAETRRTLRFVRARAESAKRQADCCRWRDPTVRFAGRRAVVRRVTPADAATALPAFCAFRRRYPRRSGHLANPLLYACFQAPAPPSDEAGWFPL